jgi:7-carboxy-7-deazaguanine synthase (Cx14CxxC type)
MEKMKTYSVKEIFYTLQGEGAQAGRPAVFLRFAGCNLWSGREEDRATALCTFCDTDFVGTDGTLGGKYKGPDSLAEIVNSLWPESTSGRKYVVCTGGEPLLQLDDDLIRSLHNQGFEIAIETNGTLEVPEGVDWVCMSPKPGLKIQVTSGDELKFIFPQSNLDPGEFENYDFHHFFIQPMDGPFLQTHTEAAIAYCMAHPHWRLSLQTHKWVGIR